MLVSYAIAVAIAAAIVLAVAVYAQRLRSGFQAGQTEYVKQCIRWIEQLPSMFTHQQLSGTEWNEQPGWPEVPRTLMRAWTGDAILKVWFLWAPLVLINCVTIAYLVSA